jgi:hypothetical protein
MGDQMTILDMTRTTFVVYDPPFNGFPYLAVAFVPGNGLPQSTPFLTAAEAEAFNKQAAAVIAQRELKN